MRLVLMSPFQPMAPFSLLVGTKALDADTCECVWLQWAKILRGSSSVVTLKAKKQRTAFWHVGVDVSRWHNCCRGRHCSMKTEDRFASSKHRQD